MAACASVAFQTGTPVLVGAHHHRLRSVEDHPERHPARGLEASQERADQRLCPLVRHPRHPHPARVLEPVGREVDPLRPPLREPDVHLAEVELGKLPGHPLEAHHQLPGDRPSHLGPQSVEGALAHLHSLFPEPAQNLLPGRLRVPLHQRPHPIPRPVRHPRTAHPAGPSRRRVIRRLHPRLPTDPPHRTTRDPEVPRHLPSTQPCRKHLLNGMSIDHPEHPPPPPVQASSTDPLLEAEILR
jgi:hypothetical protein